MTNKATEGPVVAIDLGTTNSLIGIIEEGGAPQLFRDERGSALLPSVVAVRDGRVVVGRAARNQLLLQPLATVARSKRHMGGDKVHQLGDRSVSSTEVAAFILSELLDRAEAELKVRPKRAIITVPAFFKDAQRQATRDAGELAGLSIERLVNEPTAAALNYETGQESRVLIYDFGGGTFDVSVLDRDEGFLEVRSSHGDTELGGSDIDAALLERVLDKLGAQRAQVEGDARALSRLTEAVERAKIALSEKSAVQLVEPFLTGDGSQVVNVDLELTRAELETVLQPFVERTLHCIDRALKDAAVEATTLDRAILVGGTSKIPYVQRRVSEHLKMPTQVDEQAELAVALGAVRLAGRAQGLAVEDVLVDVTPHTLAAGVLDRDNDQLIAAPVIARNTVVPCVSRETYFTAFPNQSAVDVPIVQGEHRLAEDNTQLGRVRVENLPPGPAGSEIDVEFRLDLSGTLQVSATHVRSGKQAEIRIADSPYRLSAQERRSAKSMLRELRQPAETENTTDNAELELARALLERASTALANKAANADAAALKRVEQAQALLQAALVERLHSAEVVDLADHLSDALLDLL